MLRRDPAREVLDGSCMARLLAFTEALQPRSAATHDFQPAWHGVAG